MGLDEHTTAFFPFGGSLDGEGTSPEGKRFEIRGVLGVVEHW